MNCDQFRKELGLYLDGDRSSAVCAHLETCSRCRRVLAEAEVVSTSIRRCLRSSAEQVSLSIQKKRDIVAALQATPEGWALRMAGWREAISLFLRPVGGVAAGLVIICLALLVVGRRASTPSPGTAQPESLVVNVPLQRESHVFRLRHGFVVDGLVAENVTLASGYLPLKNAQ